MKKKREVNNSIHSAKQTYKKEIKKSSNFPIANNASKIDYQLLMQQASSQPVASTYSKLGPIESYSDLLISDQKNHCEILAAEHIIHMTEALRYLSSAMYAYLNNERYHAIHLAYYAELRAVLSLYAGSGIRTEKIDLEHEKPYFIDKEGNKCFYAKFVETHPFASMAWKEWIQRNDAQALLWESIYLLPGVSLGCLKPHLSRVNPELLRSLAFDLDQIKEDRNARNVASYKAYWRFKCFLKMEKSQVRFARELARLFTKSETGLLFDKVLVQYLVEEIVRSNVEGDESSREIEEKFTDTRDELIRQVARSSGIEENSIKAHLNISTTSLFDKAKEPTVDIENILARAAFLARLAMLSVGKNVASSGNPHIRRWIQNWLEHCGCWISDEDVELEDLEADYCEAIEDFSPDKFQNMPADLWSKENVQNTLRIANPHMCLAWGLTS